MFARQMKFMVDLAAPLTTQVMPGVLQQGDAYANTLIIDVYENGWDKPKAIGGLTVSGYFLRGDGDRVLLEGSTEESKALVELNENCYAYSGSYAAFVRIADGESKTTILRIAGMVEGEGEGAVIDPANRIPSVDDVIAQLENMERATESAANAASSAQSAAQRAEKAAESAEAAGEATQAASEAATRANKAAEAIDGMTVTAQTVEYGTGASAETSRVDGKIHLLIRTERGPQGETGHGLDIKGTYGTIEALRAAVPNPTQGDMYNVGTRVPHSIYMWDDGLGDWIYQGELQGATGAHYTPVITETADAVTLGWNNDGGLENPPAVNIRGRDGYTPVKGTDYWTADDKNGIVQDVLAALPNASGVSF